MTNIIGLIFFTVPLLISAAIGLVVLMGLWRVFNAIADRLQVRVFNPPTVESPEVLAAIRSGYSPRLGLSLSDIFPERLDRQDIDRIVEIRTALFPHDIASQFYSTNSLQDLEPAEFKALALRLYLEMAFTRSYLLERSPRRWTARTEELWQYHTPKPLRKLNPDFYRQLFAELGRSHTHNPVAV